MGENLELRSHRPGDSHRWYSGLVSAPQPIESADFPMPEVDGNGVGLTQVRRMLALTPAERLRMLESALASMIKVRDAVRSEPSHLMVGNGVPGLRSAVLRVGYWLLE